MVNIDYLTFDEPLRYPEEIYRPPGRTECRANQPCTALPCLALPGLALPRPGATPAWRYPVAWRCPCRALTAPDEPEGNPSGR